MLNKDEILLFLSELISVGVQHTVLPDRLFFYYGILIKVDENVLTLRTNDGFKIVPIEQILDIHTDNWRK